MATAISFFTGAGGLDIGLHQAGFDIKLSLELEKTYCETLRTNHPDWNVVQGDIMDLNKQMVYDLAGLDPNTEIDLFAGGSPCQSFSTAGNRQAFGDVRGQAMLKYADLISEVKPKYFILENVKGLLSAALKHRPLNQRGKNFPPLEPDEEPGSALRYVLDRFKGYKIQYKLINSADHGIPQARERVFMIGSKISPNVFRNYSFPEPTHSKIGANGKRPWRTVGEVLFHLEQQNIEHHYMSYSEERLRYMRMIPAGGGNWRNLPDDVVQEAMGGAYTSGGGKVGFFRRVNVDKPAPTLLTSPAQKSTNIGHPFEDRPLSIEEYLAIQEFPEGYQVAGKLSDQYTQIGNAVPVRLGKVIGESILPLVKKRRPPSARRKGLKHKRRSQA
jgi:DNA (cytosine-5)-methyltransferase 1